MVAAEDDREDAPVGDLGHSLADRRVRQLHHPVRADRVAVVDDLQLLEELDAKIEMECPRPVSERPKRPRAKSCAGTVGCRVVPGRSDDCYVRLPPVQLLGLGEQRPLSKGCGPCERGTCEL